MPKRTDIESILIIGAGPIVIGQACEFDYSGMQACKALREEGYRTILVNSNPATIMTDPDSADAIYIEPLCTETLTKIIERERPDALLPTMGGQTALNCSLDLIDEGVLEKFGVEMIGASREAIDLAEDRKLFRRAMDEIGLESARSIDVSNWEEAQKVPGQIAYPIIVRPSFTLGGSGSGIAYNAEQFETIVKSGLELSPVTQVLLEESLLGWKEFEMEVVRDTNDNCIIVCSIENLDPMGVHTGDSITVAPAQTLTDKEYQKMRDASIQVLRKVGVETGGSNVQFALNPDNGRLIVIEMNPRVSRSSALASKATGFPIAKVASKLAVGYTLDELRNEITGGAMPASFEPTIDYIVTKVPRFTFEKFPECKDSLDTQMRSVGETMAIGSTFQESLQKALNSLESGYNGFNPIHEEQDLSTLELRNILRQGVDSKRLWRVADALRRGVTVDELYEDTSIDRWFLRQIEDLILWEAVLESKQLAEISESTMAELKAKGFSDSRLAELLSCSEQAVLEYRHKIGLHPVYKHVDTCSAEFDSSTAYLYSTYADECEANPTDQKKVVILGSGPNRIGQGIEFDYCCVHTAFALKEAGFETIMINCNPETVSTDYDTSDRLYFEPLDFEHVLEIIRLEKPQGVLVQYGGQTPLKLAKRLAQAGVHIFGTSPDSIDLAEDRERFQKLVTQLNLKQPDCGIARTTPEALALIEHLQFPVMVRPSYVLGGRAMEVIYQRSDLESYMEQAIKTPDQLPVLIDRFLNDAIEVDVDAICDGTEVVVTGVMEHIEQAGIHSGDSACSLPAHSLCADIIQQIHQQTTQLAHALSVRGIMNVQFAVKDNEIYIIEVNPRASRTVPFVSKATGVPVAKIAARCAVGQSLAEQGCQKMDTLKHFSVKEAVFPFMKFSGVDPLLGPEMRSTGEVMGIGASFGEAYRKAQIAAGNALPALGKALISVRDSDKEHVEEVARRLLKSGFTLIATVGTADHLSSAGIKCDTVHKVTSGKRPHIIDVLNNSEIHLIINTTEGQKAVADSYAIRRAAVQRKVCYTTTIAGALAITEALQAKDNNIYRLQDIHER